LFLCVPQSIKPRCCPLFASLQGATGCRAVMPFANTHNPYFIFESILTLGS
jgi:hypothetical protein